MSDIKNIAETTIEAVKVTAAAVAIGTSLINPTPISTDDLQQITDNAAYAYEIQREENEGDS
jgi:2-keto-3-deoxy-6-phosphogluconate aldolase